MYIDVPYFYHPVVYFYTFQTDYELVVEFFSGTLSAGYMVS